MSFKYVKVQNIVLYCVVLGCLLQIQLDIQAQVNVSSISGNATTDTLYASKKVEAADSLLRLSQTDKALNQLMDAGKVFQKHKAWRSYVLAYNRIGQELYRAEEYDKALELLNEAKLIGSKYLTKKSLALSDTYDYIGKVYRRKGNYDRALDFHLLSLEIQKEIYGENHPSLDNTYFNIGNVYYYNGDYLKSLQYNQKVLNMQLQIFRENHPKVAVTYSNIGLIHTKLKNYEQALEAYNKALNIQLKNRLGESDVVSIYTELSNIYTEQGDYTKALESSEKALEIINRVFDATHDGLPKNYNNIGSIYLKQKKYDKALEFYNEALEHQKELVEDQHPYVADSYLKIGETYSEQKEYKQALNYYQKALMALVDGFTNSDINAHPPLQNASSETYLLETLSAKAQTFEKLYQKTNQIKNLVKSLENYQLAAQVIGILCTHYRADEYKLFTFEESKFVYEGGIEVAKQLYNKSTDAIDKKRFLSIAFSLAEKSKKAFLVESLKTTELRQFIDIPESTIEQEQEMKIELAYYKRQLLDEEQKGLLNNERVEKLKKKIKGLSVSYKSLVANFKEKFPDYYKLKYDTTVTSLSQLSNALATHLPNTAYIQYFQRRDSIPYAFVVTPQDAHIYSVEDENGELTQTIYKFGASILDYERILKQPEEVYQTYTKKAYDLYVSILKQAIDFLQDKEITELVIVPDAILCYTPFDALLTKKVRANPRSAGDYRELPYIMNQYPISYAYFATDFVNALENGRQNQKGRHLGIGMIYDREAVAVSTDLLVSRIARDVNVELRGAKEEVRNIAEITEGDVILDKRATERAFRGAINQYDVAHVALHTLLDDTKPLSSKIVFASSNDTLEDGYLNVHELYKMSLNTELIVLSAARNTTDRLYNGEGNLHLSKAFDYAGCSSLLASLWRTEDDAVQDLMQGVYQELRKGTSISSALQISRQNYLQRNQSKAHPYFWAGFWTIGNPTPVDTGGSWIWMLIAGAVGLTIVIYFGRMA